MTTCTDQTTCCQWRRQDSDKCRTQILTGRSRPGTIACQAVQPVIFATRADDRGESKDFGELMISPSRKSMVQTSSFKSRKACRQFSIQFSSSRSAADADKTVTRRSAPGISRFGRFASTGIAVYLASPTLNTGCRSSTFGHLTTFRSMLLQRVG